MFMAAITSDKGPEDYREVEGEQFFKLYGNNISFAKHGQPLLQAAASINAGARLFVKRVVAPDAKLANLAVLANVSKVETQKTNTAGEALYTDATTGAETINAVAADGTPNEPVMITKAKIKYETVSVENESDIAAISSAVLGSVGTVGVGDEGVRPLFVITDIGRGASRKNIQIAPDYTSSKSVDYTRYMFNVLENNETIEAIQFGFNPSIVDNGVNVSLQHRLRQNSTQVNCYQFEDQMENFIETVAKIAGIDKAEFVGTDMLFGRTKKGVAIETIEVDATGINLSHPYGLSLVNGDDGEFAVPSVFEAPSYEDQMAKVFTEEYSSEPYDLDNHKIDLVIDANYPATVKRAIERFVEFRQDCFYLRDLGLYLDTIDMILAADRESSKSYFCASYHNSYDIIDPYSKKQIAVTVGYSLAKLMVNHFLNGRNRPLAGQLHDMIITDAIEGTLNFKPAITPSRNEKEELNDARINYASYYDNVLVLETTYTAQEKDSQFSFINNILNIQEVIKAVRTKCPKIRYSFLDGDDLEKYQEDVQQVLDKYSSNFLSLTLEYINDAVYISNKIYYAAIKVQFRNFVQTEYFKVIALPS